MKKIQILLSTYNGERFIREQLDSYAALDNFEEIKVLIRDDGSTDKTPEILDEYREKYGFEVTRGENIGLNASMYQLVLMRDRSCEYYAFSDQDDVWLSNKLSAAVKLMDTEDSSVPLLYSATSNITDVSLNVVGQTKKPNKKISFFNAMTQNVCIGHTSVMNTALANVLERSYSDGICVFDHWTYLLASAVGKVIFDFSPPKTLYRQHEKNAIGYGTSGIKTFFARCKRAMTTRKAERVAKQIEGFVLAFGDFIPAEYKEECLKFLRKRKNFFTRLSYIFSTKVYRQTFAENLFFRFMYLFGKYNTNNNKEKESV